MATHTVIADRHTVHVGMAGHAVHRCFTKHHRAMAHATVNLGMFSFQRKIGSAVVKRYLPQTHFPAAGIVALGAVDLQFCPMGRLGQEGHEAPQEQHY